jgi:hypothetical protein
MNLKGLLQLTSEEWRKIWIDIISKGITNWAWIIGGSIVIVVPYFCINSKVVLLGLVQTISVPLYVLIILAPSPFVFALSLWRRSRAPKKPEHVLKYKRDKINDVIWTWDYDKDNGIINILGLCQLCETEVSIVPITPDCDPKPHIYCPHCNKTTGISGTANLIEGHILPKIKRSIRKGEWKNQVM